MADENWKENDPLYQYIQQNNNATGNGTSIGLPDWVSGNRPNDFMDPEDPNAPRGTYRPRWSNTQDVAERYIIMQLVPDLI